MDIRLAIRNIGRKQVPPEVMAKPCDTAPGQGENWCAVHEADWLIGGGEHCERILDAQRKAAKP
jgi:hypothetical protein